MQAIRPAGRASPYVLDRTSPNPQTPTRAVFTRPAEEATRAIPNSGRTMNIIYFARRPTDRPTDQEEEGDLGCREVAHI